MTLSGVETGILFGSFPTICMLVASFFLVHVKVGEKVEACFQNFCAGLLIAAVAGELYPLVMDESAAVRSLGVTFGFTLGLSLIYGVEVVINYFEDAPAPAPDCKTVHTYELKEGDEQSEFSENPMMAQRKPRSSSLSLSDKHEHPTWDEEDVLLSSTAFKKQEHRDHIIGHLEELKESVSLIDVKTSSLLVESNMSAEEIEDLTEDIDEETHKLQYKLCHCRRLLQGSQSGVYSNTVSGWHSHGKREEIKDHIAELQVVVEHILEHVHDGSDVHDADTLQEIHHHMDELDTQILQFHNSATFAANKWKRSRPFPITQVGDAIPVSLFVPVAIDGFVDGFLIGVACALSTKAGLILALANCLEMSFLGMAYTSRVMKCTGSSLDARYIAICLPPLVMLLAAAFGGFVGSLSADIPVLFTTFVSFGIVSLLFLVCNELIIEARAAHEDDEKWWITVQVYVGIFVVIVLSALIEG